MYTAKDARIATGMEDRKPTFDRWMAAGIARPTVTSRGSGYPAQWTLESILALEITKRLGAIGFNLRIAADIAEKAVATNKWIQHNHEHSVWVCIDMLKAEKAIAKRLDIL